MRPVDLIVCGTVAVNRRGVRVGKGGGYSDLEFALLVEAGLMIDETQRDPLGSRRQRADQRHTRPGQSARESMIRPDELRRLGSLR